MNWQQELSILQTQAFRAFWEITQRKCHGNEFSCWPLTIQVSSVISPRDCWYLPGCTGQQAIRAVLRPSDGGGSVEDENTAKGEPRDAMSLDSEAPVLTANCPAPRY